MFDFLFVKQKVDEKKKSISVYPGFLVGKRSADLMTKGKAFYAVWDEENNIWSKDENRACQIMDAIVERAVEDIQEKKPGYYVAPIKIQDFDSRRYTAWQSYCKSIPDSYELLDEKVIFANDPLCKEDLASMRLPYAMVNIPTPNYDELMSTLYSETEREKIEWAIGSIIAGDSKDIQKFYVFYGEPGSGKSTVLKIIHKMFDGYCTTFDAKAVGSSQAAFSLEPFRDNPLIAIQDDGDLFHIEDNTRLNSIASHESLIINEKHKATYTIRLNAVMFIGTNKPVRITDAKAGIIRRLIDISPSGKTIPRRKYDAIIDNIDYEFGGIAYHCFEVYKKLGKRYYDKYKPMKMMGITNDFYNFMDDNYDFFYEHRDKIQLKRAWQLYKEYCQEANVQYPFTMKAFKEEMKTYYDEFLERFNGERKIYCGFRTDKFAYQFDDQQEEEQPYSLVFDHTVSELDRIFENCKAQYASSNGKPLEKWDEVTTKLKDIDTSKLHYLLPDDIQHIVIDFDLKNENGEKDFLLNLEAASKWPATYAELSKSGCGIHLHYIYEGDVSKLNRIYAEGIEIKVFTGKSSLRRCLTKCNNLPIARISSGLPLKGDKPMVNLEAMQSEKQLRALIKNCLLKKHHGATKPEVDYIYDTLEKCYASGMHYDVTDMRPDITAFANNSTNQALACLKLVSKMKWKSAEPSEAIDNDEASLMFFDCEVFPNLFVVCFKFEGENKSVSRMINPSPEDVEALFKYRLVGYNNRRYDNHILYARSLGYSNEELFTLSTRIVAKKDKTEDNRNCFFMEAYNLSYTDVLDFAFEKKSLKKWEIELGIHHQENEYPWDQPVPEDKWEEIADYCSNDVIATEAVFKHLKENYEARLMLADISDGTANDTTNSLTTKLIFGREKHPQLVYTNLKTGERTDGSRMPYCFPEYEFVKGEDGKYHNMYRGIDLGFGGYVFGDPGMYTKVALLDVASMHPTSIVLLNKLGEYTSRFADLKQARVYIKHHDYISASKMFDGKLAKYLTNDEKADALSTALKYPINAEYGQSFASYPNPSKDPRDVNNIIALLGALFMKTLQDEVTAKGYRVIAIRTDSIKIADADDSIISFVQEFAKKYGYEMEHEATYEKMCLVNDAVYIAKYDDKGVRNKGGKHAGEWTATGAEFQVPYIFKTLFSHEPLTFKDYCVVKEVKEGSLYLDMNEKLKDEHDYRFIGRIGEFCPISPGNGGGELYRIKDGKAYAAAGTKGYRWLEAETVQNIKYMNNIDITYFNNLVNEAVEHISKFGDFEWFVSDDSKVIVPFEEDMNKPIIEKGA